MTHSIERLSLAEVNLVERDTNKEREREVERYQ